jgi:hypothetical protein
MEVFYYIDINTFSLAEKPSQLVHQVIWEYPLAVRKLLPPS